MKKLLLGLLLSPTLAFCDTKISALPSTTTLNSSDIIPVVTNPSNNPQNFSISKANLISTLGVGNGVNSIAAFGGTPYTGSLTFLPQNGISIFQQSGNQFNFGLALGGNSGDVLISTPGYATGFDNLKNNGTTITATGSFLISSMTASGQYCFKDGTCQSTAASGTGSGSGIVSPGTFTWVNNFGLSLSTLTVTSIKSPVAVDQLNTGSVESDLNLTQQGVKYGFLAQRYYSNSGPQTFSTPMQLSETNPLDGTQFSQLWIDNKFGVSVVGSTNTSNTFSVHTTAIGDSPAFYVSKDGMTNSAYGIVATTITVTGTATVTALALSGLGEPNYTIGTDSTPYRIVGATQTVTAGHIPLWSQDNALIDGGPPAVFANGPKGAVQYANGVLFAGSGGFSYSGSSLTLTSSMTINTGGTSTNSSPGLLNIDDSGPTAYIGKPLVSIGSVLLGNQVTIYDHQPANFSNYGALLGNVQVGANATPDTLYDAAHASNQSINFWNSGEMDIGTTDGPSGGKSIVFFPNTVKTVILSTGAMTVLSSMTVTGTGGVNATYGITAATFTATSGVAFTQTYKAAVCQAGTASLGFSTFSSSGPTAGCVISTSTVMGIAPFVDTSSMSVQDHFTLPSDWTGAVNANILWNSTTTTNSVVWQIRTACAASGASFAVTWNSFSTVTDAAITPTNALNTAAINGITTSGCSAGNEFFFEFLRDPTTASDTLTATANLVTLQLTYRRTLAL